LKLNDLDKDDREKESEHIHNTAESIGVDPWGPGETAIYDEELGLCKDCVHIRYIKTAFSVLHLSCGLVDIWLSLENLVTECNGYSKRGQMTLQVMEGMATLIDIKNREIGF